jgi:peptidyl-prolyl cis-trans isomerase B (cyclophilin B)
VSGKNAKRNKRREREAAREAARRKQRQQTIFTGIVIGIIIAIGGVLVWISIDRPDDLAEEPTDFPTQLPTDEPLAADERPVACGAEEPATAGGPRPTYPDGPEQVLEEGVTYRAVVETSCGTVVMELDTANAPEAANSFVFLASQGFFDGLEIFRNATTIGALQTGSGTDDATWQIGYQLSDELGTAQADGYPVGAVAMANSGPDTSGSQFFFVYNELFDEAFTNQRNYTRFAQVVEGLDVLEAIGAIPVEGERPTERVYMNSVRIETVDGAAGATPQPEAPGTEPPPATEPAEAATEPELLPDPTPLPTQ